MDQQERLAQQFREVRAALEPSTQQVRMVWEAQPAALNNRNSKKKTIKGKVPPPVAAAAVAALVMSPSITAFADTVKPPGEALPAQVETENSAIEQPKEQPRREFEQKERPDRPVLPKQENQVPSQVLTKERTQSDREESQNNQAKHLIDVIKKDSEENEGKRQMREENNSQQAYFTQQQEEQPERRVAPASKPANEGQKAPQSLVNETESVTLVSSQESQSKQSPSTKSDPLSNSKSEQSKQSMSTKRSEQSEPEIEVKGKLPDTASPYPLQMLASGLVSLSGIAGLVWSRKKKR